MDVFGESEKCKSFLNNLYCTVSLSEAIAVSCLIGCKHRELQSRIVKVRFGKKAQSPAKSDLLHFSELVTSVTLST